MAQIADLEDEFREIVYNAVESVLQEKPKQSTEQDIAEAVSDRVAPLLLDVVGRTTMSDPH